MDEKLKKYYEYLKQNQADVPDSYDSFASTLQDPAKAQKFHKYLRSENFDAPEDYDKWSSTLGVGAGPPKKKEETGFVQSIINSVEGFFKDAVPAADKKSIFNETGVSLGGGVLPTPTKPEAKQDQAKELIDLYDSRPKKQDQEPEPYSFFSEDDIKQKIDNGELTQEDANILRAEQDKVKQEDPKYFDKLKAQDDKDIEDAQAANAEAQTYNDTIGFYKDWAKKNGQSERVEYLIRQAQVQAESDGQKLDYYGQGKDLIPINEQGLRLWEEAISVKAEALGAKSEQVLNKAKDKLTKAQDMYTELKSLQADEQPSQASVDYYNNLVDQYKQLMTDPDIQEYIRVGEDYNKLADVEKGLYKKFPEVYDRRTKEIADQTDIDAAFASGENGWLKGSMSQIGRGLMKFAGEVAKTPASLDMDNQYTLADKWRDFVDDYVENASKGFNIPSDYNKPLFETKDGETTFNSDLLIPKTVRTITDMATLLGGASKVTKGLKLLGVTESLAPKIGLVASSFVQTQDDYRKSGLERGLNPSEAGEFATAAAGLTSMLELVSPNLKWWRPKKSEMVETVVDAVKSGQSLKEAMKVGFANAVKEVPKENVQELLQNLGDKVVEGITNNVTGKEAFDFNKDDMINEALETVVLTTLSTGAIGSGASAINTATRTANYKEAIAIAAKDPDKYMPALQESFKKYKTDPEYAKRVVNDIRAINSDIERSVLEDNAIKKQEEKAIKDSVNVGETVEKTQPVDEQSMADIPEGNDQSVGDVSKQGQKPQENAPVQDSRAQDAPVEYTKAQADQELNALVESGDISRDGKKVTVLTKKGGVELKRIDDNLAKSKRVEPQTTETKTEVKPEVNPSSIPNYDLEALSREASTEGARRAAKVLANAQKSLQKIAPDVKVVLFQNNKEGKQLLEQLGHDPSEAGEFNGFYDAKNNVIAINTDTAESNTPFHEAIHPFVQALKAKSPEKFDSFAKEASELTNPDGQKYGDVMETPEESLVELLADVADGKFDKQPTVLEKVRNWIQSILQSLGLATDQLTNPKSLNEMAQSLADALREGKVIGSPNPNAKRNEVRKQRRKLNKTAKRIAKNANTDFRQLQSDILANPDKYSYTPQKQSSKKQDLKLMSLEDLTKDQTIDGLLDGLNQKNQFAVLSAIELMRRYNAEGKDTKPIFKKLREAGTSLGQLLNQYKDLKERTPEGVASIVSDNLESLGLKLTEPQSKVLDKLAKDYIQAVDKKEVAREKFVNNATEANQKALDKELDNLADKFAKLSDFTGKVTPLGLDKMLTTLLQGNLLVPKSIVTNVVGNLVNVTKYPERISGSLAVYFANRFKGVPINAAELFFGNTFEGMKTFLTSWPTAIKNSVTGRMADSGAMKAFEIRKNLHPLDSLWQLLSKKGRSMLPVNAKGNVPFAVWAEKTLEGTIGQNAELMFRLLYAGDQPFRNSAKVSAQYRVYAEDGGKSKYKSFDRFLQSITPEQSKRVDRMVNEAVFSEEGELYQVVDKALKGFDQAGDKIEEFTGKTITTALRVLSKASLPYVKVPANLVQRAVEYSMPLLPLVRAVVLARKGEVRRAGEAFGRAAVGFAMINLMDTLYHQGIIIAGASGDDKDKRSLKYESAKPNSINVSALNRYLAGDMGTEIQKDDKFWDYNRFGMLGIVAAIRSEVLESIEDKYKQPISEIDPVTATLEKFNGAINGSLEISFLQGMLNLKDEWAQRGATGVTTEMLSSASSIFLSNNLLILTKSNAPYILKAKDESAIKEMQEKLSTKIFPNLEDNVTGVYPIISMWGEPVAQTPEGRDPKIYQFLDITNSKEIRDEASIDIWNLSQRMGDVPLSTPSAQLIMDGRRYEMTEQDYTYLQMLAGRYKKIEVNALRDEWEGWSDEDKFDELKSINEEANSFARDYMLEQIEDGIDSGNIVLDERLGKYSYVKPSEFDFDYYLKAIE